MTSKMRMLTAMRNRQPDMVPVAPDMSNMIPCKLTGKPFWDVYLYQDPPLWKAYIEAVKYFGFDGWVPMGAWYVRTEWVGEHTVIVEKSKERIVTRQFEKTGKKTKWSDFVTVYPEDNPPTRLRMDTPGLNLEPEPKKTWPIEIENGPDKELFEEIDMKSLLKKAQALLSNTGVVGLTVGVPCLTYPDDIYLYYDNPEKVREKCRQQEESIVAYTKKVIDWKPDFVMTGTSGWLTLSSLKMVIDLGFNTVKRVTRLCKEAGIPSQIHCCGRERDLVKICAEETDLNNINPLEEPPMGDCNLKDIKKNFGSKLSLMGNLHTTKIMLEGSVRDVELASKRAIDDAAEGGGFILSTGDQCGRDTPFENIRTMIEVARTYGKY